MKKIEIPDEIKDAVIDEVEKELFPHKAKTIWGKLARVGYSIVKIFIVKKKINL